MHGPVKKKIRFVLALLLVAALLVLLQGVDSIVDERLPENQESEEPVHEEVVFADTGDADQEATGNPPLSDNSTLYEGQDATGITYLYLTVMEGNETENTDHTLSDINNYSVDDYEDMGTERYQASCLLQKGDANGPAEGEFGYGLTEPNATIQIRGQSSTIAEQKNYKIRLRDDAGLLDGLQTIALNKHALMGLRYMNHLMFDTMTTVSQIVSLRTRFVHLYVKDLTTGGNAEFTDYGLYTQVEQWNRRALRDRNLNDEGDLYKINEYEFRENDAIVPTDDPSYDEDAFSELLENKNGTDNRKLIRLIEDLNDASLTADEVIDKHFSRENLVYWMAFMILTENLDTQNRNFYIYSPPESEIWYILPWDMDGAFYSEYKRIQSGAETAAWEKGVSNYWGNMLFRCCLTSTEFRTELDDAIEDLMEHCFTAENFEERAQMYADIVDDYCFQEPDRETLSITEDEYEEMTSDLLTYVNTAYNNYKQSLQNPMPVYISSPYSSDDATGQWEVSWDTAYDLQDQLVRYHAEISENPDMSNPVSTYEGMEASMHFDPLPDGTWYVKVVSTDSDGNEGMAFDSTEVDGQEYPGVKMFEVQDGKVVDE